MFKYILVKWVLKQQLDDFIKFLYLFRLFIYLFIYFCYSLIKVM